MSLTTDIKKLALDAGFHAVGVTSAAPFAESERALRGLYDKGLLEGSGYDPDVIRRYTTPRETLPAARSIISVALSYLRDDSREGSVARFSVGLDYHRVMQDRLSVPAGDIRAKLGHPVEIRSFADTGPLADRSVAIRAGIGSRGKNTCVYVGEYGSWVVLGELLTDIELEPDEPATLDICGECDECMKACPTGAICAPYTVDVRICLSRVTQSRGFIPYALREKMASRIYGCDTCQSACPLNRGARPANVHEFQPSAGLGDAPELLPLLVMGAAEFNARVAPTAAGWIGRTRFRRNVAVALGNIGDPVSVPELAGALSDRSPVIRGHAAWALGEIGDGAARSALEAALAREPDRQVTAEIHRALSARGG